MDYESWEDYGSAVRGGGEDGERWVVGGGDVRVDGREMVRDRWWEVWT